MLVVWGAVLYLFIWRHMPYIFLCGVCRSRRENERKISIAAGHAKTKTRRPRNQYSVQCAIVCRWQSSCRYSIFAPPRLTLNPNLPLTLNP